MPSTPQSSTFLDAGVLIGAVAQNDPRFAEAHPLVEAARRGDFPASTSTGVLSEVYAALLHLRLAAQHQLTARRIHDARHAATALQHGVTDVYTYDPEDWSDFASAGLTITGPPSVVARRNGTS